MERRPQSSRLTWLAVALGAGACAILGHVGADARWLAALGRAILAQGSIPSGVPYAAAPSVDWVNVPVLGELVFHALQAVGGDRGLLFAQLLGASAALALLASGMRALGASDAASALVVLLVFVGGFPSFIIVRAQLFSLVLFCLALLLLRAEAHRPIATRLAPRSADRALGEPARRRARRTGDRRRLSRARTCAARASCGRRRPRGLLCRALSHTGFRLVGQLLPWRAPERGCEARRGHVGTAVLQRTLRRPLRPGGDSAARIRVPLRPESVGACLHRGIRRADAACRPECNLAPLFHCRARGARSRKAVPP